MHWSCVSSAAWLFDSSPGDDLKVTVGVRDAGSTQRENDDAHVKLGGDSDLDELYAVGAMRLRHTRLVHRHAGPRLSSRGPKS
jgi:hypothetical protein